MAKILNQMDVGMHPLNHASALLKMATDVMFSIAVNDENSSLARLTELEAIAKRLRKSINGTPHVIRFCEFTGDDEHDHDEVGYKRLCISAGFEHCQRHKLPLGQYQGWRVCCDECTTPVQVKTIKP